MNKFELQASESAPENYPIQVISGNLSLKDGNSLYIPNGGLSYHGWGSGISSHVTGEDFKSLPTSVSISFFSYLENKFYEASFDLPYEKILKLFQKGYFSPNEEKNITYHRIITGVSPGGGVSVWLDGIDRRTEILFGWAKEYDGNWGAVTPNTSFTREEYIARRFKDVFKTNEEITKHTSKTIPLKRWEKYHKTRYQWQPKFTQMPLRDLWITDIKYYNGEEGYLNYPLNEDELKMTRAVPMEIKFTWSFDKETNYYYEVFFDEKEMFDVFEKLGKNNTPLELEMRVSDHETGKRFTLLVNNDKESLQLNNYRLETYDAD